jgi:NAD kinase
MKDDTANRYILVSRKTRLQELIERFNTWPQAKFYLEHNEADTQDYLEEHDRYQREVEQIQKALKGLGRYQRLDKTLLPSYQFRDSDVVIVVGQDGLVANTLKYLTGQPLVGVNPDPDRWDGVLLPFTSLDLTAVLSDIEHGTAKMSSVTLAEASTNDGQRMLAVNDLFIGPKSHTSAHYQISWQGQVERQSSSGIIVSTGMGSTGWLQSLVAGAQGVTGTQGHTLTNGFARDARRLQFTVREPFPSRTSGVKVVFGEIAHTSSLEIASLMPENGVIFSDGVEQDFLQFNSGCTVSIGVAQQEGMLVDG